MLEHTPAQVFPPGDFILEELDARGWTQTDLAKILNRPVPAINEIVAGKRGITPDTAVALAGAFGTSSELWMNLETTYRLSLAAPTDPQIARRAKLYGLFPVREMVRRQWVEDANDIELLERRVCSFLSFRSIDDEPAFGAAARKSTSYESATRAQVAWLARTKQLAKTVPAAAFDDKEFASQFPLLRSLAKNAQDVRRVPQMLAEMGVRLVVVEPLAKTKIDGAAFWLDDRSPVIALSLRTDRIDSFWFTLVHECVHIVNRDKESIDIELVGQDRRADDELPEFERVANQQAAELLIRDQDICSFIARTQPYYAKTKILGFAERIGVHPGIVVGQLQHRKEILWSHSRDLVAKVRALAVSATLTDGWDNVSAQDN